MKRRSFLASLAALPFLPKLLKKPEAEALTGKEAAAVRARLDSAWSEFIAQAPPSGILDEQRQLTRVTPALTSGTYSDAVTYRADFAPPVFVNEIPEGIYYTDPDGFRRYAGGSWTQGDAPAPSEPLG